MNNAESVARELADSWFKDSGAGKKELAGLITQALKRCRNEALDEAAFLVENFPVYTHGALKTEPFEAANQICGELVTAILNLKKVEPLTEEEIETIDATVG